MINLALSPAFKNIIFTPLIWLHPAVINVLCAFSTEYHFFFFLLRDPLLSKWRRVDRSGPVICLVKVQLLNHAQTLAVAEQRQLAYMHPWHQQNWCWHFPGKCLYSGPNVDQTRLLLECLNLLVLIFSVMPLCGPFCFCITYLKCFIFYWKKYIIYV